MIYIQYHVNLAPFFNSNFLQISLFRTWYSKSCFLVQHTVPLESYWFLYLSIRGWSASEISNCSTLLRLLACKSVIEVKPPRKRAGVLLKLSACASLMEVSPLSIRMPTWLKLSAWESVREVRPFNCNKKLELKRSACFSVIEVKPSSCEYPEPY